MKKHYVNSWGIMAYRFFRKKSLKKALHMLYTAKADDRSPVVARILRAA